MIDLVKTSYSILFIPLILFSCSKDPEVNSSSETATITISELTNEHYINDDLSFIDGEINDYIELSNNRAIITDNKPGVYLMEDYKITRVFGALGEGPCEYTSVSSIDVDNGKLYVLSSEQTRIVEYDIETGTCEAEFTTEQLNRFNYMVRLTGEAGYLVGRGSSTGMLADTTTILKKVYEDGSALYLPFRHGRTNMMETTISIRGPAMDFSANGDDIYMYFSMTDSVYRYHIPSGSISSFDMQIDLKRDEIEGADNDPQKILALINDEYPLIDRLLVTSDWIGIVTRKVLSADGAIESRSDLRVYTTDGIYIGSEEIKDQIIDADSNELTVLVSDQDPNSPYSFSIGKKKISIR